MRVLRVGLGVMVLVSAAPAAVFRVPSDYPTIQAGLDAAAAGDTVLAAPGTYTDWETRGTRSACVFLVDGVTLLSEGGPPVTTIDMQGQGTTQPSVIFGILLNSGQTVVEGFTITGIVAGRSGVLLASSGKVTFRDCIIRDMDGGANPGGVTATCDLDLFNCEFRNLRGSNLAGGVGTSDVGILVNECLFTQCVGGALGAFNLSTAGPTSAVVQNSVFIDNTGGVAALNIQLTNATVIDCYFEGNVNDSNGALSIGVPGTWSVSGCTFFDNACTLGGCVGGALGAGGPSGTLTGCTLEGSAAQSGVGGAVFLSGGPVLLSKNVVANSQGLAIWAFSGTSVTSTCNVFWNNAGGNTTGFLLGPMDRIADPLYCDAERVNVDETLTS